MAQQGSVHTPLVFGIAAAGALIGLIICVGGPPVEVEAWLWIAAFIGSIVAGVVVDSERTYLDVALGSVLSGLSMAAVMTLLFDLYHRNHPMALYDMPIERLEFAAVVFSRGLKIGVALGVIAGGIAGVIVAARRRMKKKAALED